MVWEGVNRRRFPRANYSCIVKLRKKGSAESFNTRTENIGCGGVCVMLPKDVGIFSLTELEIDLQDGKDKIKCDGTVVWVVRRREFNKDKPDYFDTGIEFVDLKEEDKKRIDTIIKQCLQKEKS